MFVHADIGTQCYVDGWGGVGWDDNVHVTRDAQRPCNAQVQQFAAKRLLEKPGLMPLVTAFAEYRRDRKNQMGIQPGHAFQIEKDNAWLPWKKGVDTPPKTNTTKPSYTW